MSRIAYIGDSRFLRTDDGRVWTTTSHFGGEGWKRGLEGVPGVALVGRSRAIRSIHDLPATSRPVTCDDFVGLPDFSGAVGLLRSFPLFLAAIARVVATNERILVRVPSVSGILAVGFARICRRWVACEVVGDIGDVDLSGKGSAIAKGASRLGAFITRLAVRQASAVRYMTKETLQKKYPPNKRAEVVSLSSVTLDEFWFEQAWSSDRAGRPPTLVNIGTMEQIYKGQDSLIRLLRSLHDEGIQCRLLLIGDGRKRASHEQLAAQLGLTEWVQFVGYVRDREIIRQCLLSCDAFLLPSHTEGLPRALLEAMALGLPCIANRVGGCVELLESEYTVSVGDEAALASITKELLTDPSMHRLKILSERNRRVAKGYSVERLAPLKMRWRSVVSG